MILCPVQSPCRLTQGFGDNPLTYQRFGLKAHNGVDYTGPVKGVSVPVHTPYDALVWKVGDQGNDGYGKYIRLLTDPDGNGRIREVVLAHFKSILVKQGDRVFLGDAVGMMGNTGFSTGMHVHVGLRYRRPDLTILNYENGFLGYTDFEPYVRYWKNTPDMVSLINQ